MYRTNNLHGEMIGRDSDHHRCRQLDIVPQIVRWGSPVEPVVSTQPRVSRRRVGMGHSLFLTLSYMQIDPSPVCGRCAVRS